MKLWRLRLSSSVCPCWRISWRSCCLESVSLNVHFQLLGDVVDLGVDHEAGGVAFQLADGDLDAGYGGFDSLVEPLLPDDEVMDLGREPGEAFGQLDELVAEDEAAHCLVELGVFRQEFQEVVAGVDGRCHVVRISVCGWDTGYASPVAGGKDAGRG